MNLKSNAQKHAEAFNGARKNVATLENAVAAHVFNGPLTTEAKAAMAAELEAEASFEVSCGQCGTTKSNRDVGVTAAALTQLGTWLCASCLED